MCDKIQISLCKPQSWAGGRGKFSPGFLSPLASYQQDDMIAEDLFDLLASEEDLLADVFPPSFFEDDNQSFSDISYFNTAEDNISNSMHPVTAITDFSTAADNRHCAILKWKAKKSKQRSVRKVCIARSIVARSRERVKGKFQKKASFIPHTQLAPQFD